jgi:hypothetical protein
MFKYIAKVIASWLFLNLSWSPFWILYAFEHGFSSLMILVGCIASCFSFFGAIAMVEDDGGIWSKNNQ